ncbi:hypothetical protein Tco_1570180 [Tanacetum coccineum]
MLVRRSIISDPRVDGRSLSDLLLVAVVLILFKAQFAGPGTSYNSLAMLAKRPLVASGCYGRGGSWLGWGGRRVRCVCPAYSDVVGLVKLLLWKDRRSYSFLFLPFYNDVRSRACEVCLHHPLVNSELLTPIASLAWFWALMPCTTANFWPHGEHMDEAKALLECVDGLMSLKTSSEIFSYASCSRWGNPSTLVAVCSPCLLQGGAYSGCMREVGESYYAAAVALLMKARPETSHWLESILYSLDRHFKRPVTTPESLSSNPFALSNMGATSWMVRPDEDRRRNLDVYVYLRWLCSVAREQSSENRKILYSRIRGQGNIQAASIPLAGRRYVDAKINLFRLRWGLREPSVFTQRILVNYYCDHVRAPHARRICIMVWEIAGGLFEPRYPRNILSLWGIELADSKGGSSVLYRRSMEPERSVFYPSMLGVIGEACRIQELLRYRCEMVLTTHIWNKFSVLYVIDDIDEILESMSKDKNMEDILL